MKYRQLRKALQAKCNGDDRFVGRDFKNIDPVESSDKLLKEAKFVIQKTKHDVDDRTFLQKLKGSFLLLLKVPNKYIDLEVLIFSIQMIEQEIYECYEEDYVPTGVFVTFEKEEGQRKALKFFDHGKIQTLRQVHGKDIVTTFGGRILNVIEPSEPSTINYLELGTPLSLKVFRIIFTLAITFSLVVICSLVVVEMRVRSSFEAAITISLFNVAIPAICKKIQTFESHVLRGDSLISLYFKITLFRW